MLRVSVLTLAAALAACAAPVQQQPQAETAAASPATPAAADAPVDEPAAGAPPVTAGAIWPPRMPSAGNFEEVPLGKWADYQETYLDAATIKERVALVAREGDGVTLETTTETASASRATSATRSRMVAASRYVSS
jgi:hypothetical protein